MKIRQITRHRYEYTVSLGVPMHGNLACGLPRQGASLITERTVVLREEADSKGQIADPQTALFRPDSNPQEAKAVRIAILRAHGWILSS